MSPTCCFNFASLACISPRTTTKVNLPSLTRVYIKALAVCSLGTLRKFANDSIVLQSGVKTFSMGNCSACGNGVFTKRAESKRSVYLQDGQCAISTLPDAIGKKVSLSL